MSFQGQTHIELRSALIQQSALRKADNTCSRHFSFILSPSSVVIDLVNFSCPCLVYDFLVLTEKNKHKTVVSQL